MLDIFGNCNEFVDVLTSGNIYWFQIFKDSFLKLFYPWIVQKQSALIPFLAFLFIMAFNYKTKLLTKHSNENTHFRVPGLID